MMTIRSRDLLGALLATIIATGANADEPKSTEEGFLVRHTATIAAAPEVVYRALVDGVGKWWSPVHTWSGDAGNLSIDPRPGGCFCERLADGGGVEHLRVVYVAPNRMLRLTGGLGPLQGSGIYGSLTWQLGEVPEGTSVNLSYSVGGYWDGGIETIAPAVNGVLLQQLERLERYVETGSPDAPSRDRPP